MSAPTWRECPSCHQWRTDVRRTAYGGREPCSDCDGHEFGRCECCGYKSRALQPPQEGGHDVLAEFEFREFIEY